MCTVTYIPIEDDSFILTHNRDESIKRVIASPPMKKMIGGIQHIFPVDPKGMGTWIGASEQGRIACILNGGNEGHQHKPPYKHSRGLIIPEYFKYSSFIDFYNHFDFSGLEPFTLLIFEGGHIFETIMDEDQLQFRKLNSEKPFIYSSSTLYTQNTRADRNVDFLEWFFLTEDKNQRNILDFHKQHFFENEKDKTKVKGGHILKTVSITSITNSPELVKVDYFDMVNDIHFWNSIKVRNGVGQTIS